MAGHGSLIALICFCGVTVKITASAVCPLGFYGSNCTQSCGLYCQSGCERTTGQCFSCVLGRTGVNCEKECSKFRYGHNCIHACGHCALDEPCDAARGLCHNGCVAGWTGPKCDKVCPKYKYGVNCEEDCGRCKGGKPCNQATGGCVGGCDPGYHGQKCDQECPEGKYGVDCMLSCKNCDDVISQNDTCDHVTGKCILGCLPGWRGLKCEQTCATGFFGTGCATKCGNCKNGSCDHVTGECPHGCAPGWMGAKCKIQCDRGTYGVNCSHSCGHCVEGTSCEQINGVCLQGCAAGWYGVFCDKECQEDYYGEGCQHRCGNCEYGTTCDRRTGLCPGGCREGWVSEYCSERELDPQQSVVTVRTPVNVVRSDSNPSFVIPLLTVAVLVLVAGLVTIAIYHLHVRPLRNRKIRDPMVLCDSGNSQSTVDEAPHVYEPLHNILWELDRSRFKITREMLGNGQFGKVRKGYVIKEGKKVQVAVKSLRENASQKDKDDFMNELKILKSIGCHPNVICLVGYCHVGETLYVSLEFASNGDLRTFLRKSRSSGPTTYSNLASVTSLTQTKLLGFGLDAARGLKHLGFKQIIHRDVAARNILLDNYLTAKVADFGLSKNDDTYIKSTNTRVPVRWMALESLFRSTYTPQSDVWAFGVLLWEVATLGGTPYADIESKQLYDMLLDGYRLPKPPGCDNALYELMYQCWMEVPEDRPTFSELCTRLEQMMEDRQVYMNLHREDDYRFAEIEMEKDDN
ncbi:protein draper-like [Liolophura sinensis]|uniref:protein draper-like n=1 Tax=Liolophura sinensis TaxID=3198878 RepID=UPI003159837E